ncbi:uncharacterized protein [Rutidosis leptorrhynchoides]|uniref:uncharacterized protein n=1 Tax=Rutidosis leptorrhynchoides TaxID=125765 RepID=UPI003A99BC20
MEKGISLKMWREKADKLEKELKLANESRLKAEAALILVQEQVDDLKAEKALLADKDKRLRDRFKELQVCLAATQNEIAQHCVASGDLNMEPYNFEEIGSNLDLDLSVDDVLNMEP